MSYAHIPEPQRQTIMVAGRQCERAMHQRDKALKRHDEIAAEHAAQTAAYWSSVAFQKVRPA